VSTNNKWRDVLPVHPAADLFPLTSETDPAAFRQLIEDIRENELRFPVTVWKCPHGNTMLLDGRNRLDALERIVWEAHQTSIISREGDSLAWAAAVRHEHLPSEVDPWAYVVSANIHRRHLTADQKRDLIAKFLKAQPEKSDRAIGKMAKADGKTVAAVRAEQEGRAEIPHVELRTDTKGRTQPAHKGWSKERYRRHRARKRARAAALDETETAPAGDDYADSRIRGLIFRAREAVHGAQLKDVSDLQLTAQVYDIVRSAAMAWGIVADRIQAKLDAAIGATDAASPVANDGDDLDIPDYLRRTEGSAS